MSHSSKQLILIGISGNEEFAAQLARTPAVLPAGPSNALRGSGNQRDGNLLQPLPLSPGRNEPRRC